MATPGIGDPYFYEWYVGLEYIIKMINPDNNISYVIFQSEKYTTIDDVVVGYHIDNPLRFRELTWRSFSSEKMIVLGTLKAEKRVLAEYPQLEEKSKHFAEIAKMLSKLGSVMLLDCMTEKDIEEYVYKKYKRIAEVDLASRGVFKKIKDAVIRLISIVRN